jgi:carboxymethylenebutenolidase
MTDTVTLTSAADGFAFTAAHAAPQGERKGGIVVVQEIFGLDQYVMADVARWSALGFGLCGRARARGLPDRHRPRAVDRA